MTRLVLALTIIASLSSSVSGANTLFEGWFEVFIGAKKVGYLTERFEFNDGKFKSTTYLKTNKDGGDITESLKAFAAADLKPLSYAYTSKTGDAIKIIDATFKGEVMNLKTSDGKKESKQTKVIKKGTFLSTFLLYLILQQKKGLTTGQNYVYNAIAEEDGVAYTGSAYISVLDKVKGKDAYKILNKFKDEKFFTWVTPKGEILLTRSPEKNIELRFAETQSQATKDMMVNLQDIKLLFGKIPGESSGGENSGDQALDEKKKKLFEKHPVTPSKGAGVPQGEGIEIKGAANPQLPAKSSSKDESQPPK